MRAYADASVLLPLFTVDAWTERSRAWISSERQGVIVSDLAAAEFAAVVARKVRMRLVAAAEAPAIFTAFDTWVAGQAAGERLDTTDLAQATTWLRRLDLNLRTPDALHLALARRLGATLVTFDAGMASAAHALGLPVAAA